MGWNNRWVGWTLLATVLVVAGCVRLGFDGQGDNPGPVSDGLVFDGPVFDGPVSDGPHADGPHIDAPSDTGVPDGPQLDVPQPEDAAWPLESTSKPDYGVLKLDALLTVDASKPVPGTWVAVVKGTFTMGSPSSEPCRESDEDKHDVILTRGFKIQSTEVTQGQFYSMMNYNPSYHSSCGNACPVETVSWHEAAAYCNALSSAASRTPCYTCGVSSGIVTCQEASSYSGQKIYDCPGYRLPTEAEWEYAYRAGTNTAYNVGTSSTATCDTCSSPAANTIGWYCGNATSPSPVGKKKANAWGIFDMAGNVDEWCNDWFKTNLGSTTQTDPVGSATGTGSYKVLRGGSWSDKAKFLRAASRSIPFAPGYGGKRFGFRCVRSQ